MILSMHAKGSLRSFRGECANLTHQRLNTLPYFLCHFFVKHRNRCDSNWFLIIVVHSGHRTDHFPYGWHFYCCLILALNIHNKNKPVADRIRRFWRVMR